MQNAREPGLSGRRGQARRNDVRILEAAREVFVADPEQHECGEPLLVRLDAADIDALADQLLADEAAHMLVTNAGDQRRLETEPSRSRRDIGR